MRIVKVLVVAAGLLLAGIARPALAGSRVAGSSGAADTTSLPVPAAVADTAASEAPAATDEAPSPAQLATLRERVDRHGVRVFLGKDAYDIRGARFDSWGIAFAPAACRASPPGTTAAPTATTRDPGRSPRRSAGAASTASKRGSPVLCMARSWGGLMGTVACAALIVRANDELGPASFTLALPPIAALFGGAIGATRWDSAPAWNHTGTRSSSAPGTPR